MQEITVSALIAHLATEIQALSCFDGNNKVQFYFTANVLNKEDANSIPNFPALTWDHSISSESPVVRGTWVTVDQICDRIKEGMPWGNILNLHPELTDDDFRACLVYRVSQGKPADTDKNREYTETKYTGELSELEPGELIHFKYMNYDERYVARILSNNGTNINMYHLGSGISNCLPTCHLKEVYIINEPKD